jgi:predicted nucleotidyltransferase
VRVDTIIAVSRALNEAGVRFIVCGGQAVIAHGYVRFTADLDIAIQLQPDSVRKAVGALGLSGYRPAIPVSTEQFADAAVRETWATEKNMEVLNFVSSADPLGTIDIFIRDPFDFDEEYAAAETLELVPGVTWRVVRLETLIRMKAAVGRPVDLDDVEHLRALKSMKAES